MKPYITDKCPKCGGVAYAEGIDVEVGYYYEPLHCECGWSEKCRFENTEECKKCTMYENCFGNEFKEKLQKDLNKQKCPSCNSTNIGIDNWNIFKGEKDWFYYCKECDDVFANTIK